MGFRKVAIRKAKPIARLGGECMAPLVAATLAYLGYANFPTFPVLRQSLFSLDVYLYNTELTERLNIRLWRNLKRSILAHNIVKVVWIVLSGPLVVFIWRVCGWSLDSVYGVREVALTPILIPVLIAVQLTSAVAMILVLKKKQAPDNQRIGLNV